MKYFILVVLFGPFIAVAQGEKLTLNDAVTKRFTHYYPKSLPQLQWIAGTNRLCWIDTANNAQQLVAIDADDEPGIVPDVLLSVDDIRATLGSYESERMPQLQWIDADQLFFKHQRTYYAMSVSSKSVLWKLELPAEAEHPSISPDKKRCAYIKDHNLYILNADGKVTQITSDGAPGLVYGQAVHRSEFGITGGMFWSKSGKKLAYYRMDEGMVTDYPLVDIQQRPASVRMIKYPMAGDKSHHVTIGVYNITNGSLTYLKTDGDPEQYLCAVTWTPKEDALLVALLNRGQDHMQVNLYDANTGMKKVQLFEEKHDRYVEPEHSAWFLPGSDDEFLWFSERHGYQHLYHYNLSGQLIKQVTRGDWEVHNIYGFDQSNNYLMVQGTGAVIKNGPKTDDTRNATQRYTYLIDFELGGTQLLDSTLGTHTAKLSDDGSHVIEYLTSIDVPLRANLFESSGKLKTRLFDAPDPTEELGISSPELITLSAGNAEPLYGRLIRPSDFDPAKKYPALIYVYGGPHAQLVRNQFLAAAPLWMYWLAEQGYIVATVDNRGSANRGIAFEQATFRNLGSTEVEDQKALIDYLKSQTYVDGERMAVHGWSYGGFMTINLMMAFPGTFQAGVAGGPVCDWRFYEVMYTERYMDTPDENPEGYKNADLIARVDELQDDLLIIHGTMDDVVVWQHSQAFVKACVDQGVQVDYFLYPGHAHNVRGRDRAHLMTKVLDYLMERTAAPGK